MLGRVRNFIRARPLHLAVAMLALGIGGGICLAQPFAQQATLNQVVSLTVIAYEPTVRRVHEARGFDPAAACGDARPFGGIDGGIYREAMLDVAGRLPMRSPWMAILAGVDGQFGERAFPVWIQPAVMEPILQRLARRYCAPAPYHAT